MVEYYQTKRKVEINEKIWEKNENTGVSTRIKKKEKEKKSFT